MTFTARTMSPATTASLALAPTCVMRPPIPCFSAASKSGRACLSPSNGVSAKKAEVVARAQRSLEQHLSPYGIEVKQFTLNELRAPEAVMQAINQKNVMQQQGLTAQNELQKNQFQAQGDSIKAITAEAEAQARANHLLAESITPTLVQYEMAKRWNGQMPQVTGSAMPMIQLPK